MQITAIKPQVKSADRYSLFIDYKYSFSLSGPELLKAGLVKDQQLSMPELRALKKLAAKDKIYSLALKWLMRRPRSAFEIATYLKTKTSDEGVREEIFKRLANLGLVDDAGFAKAYVHDKVSFKKASKRRLKFELRQKKVDALIIDQVLGADELDEIANLKQLVKQKRRQSRYRDNLKLMQYLSRQGFNYSDIKTVLKND